MEKKKKRFAKGSPKDPSRLERNRHLIPAEHSARCLEAVYQSVSIIFPSRTNGEPGGGGEVHERVGEPMSTTRGMIVRVYVPFGIIRALVSDDPPRAASDSSSREMRTSRRRGSLSLTRG